MGKVFGKKNFLSVALFPNLRCLVWLLKPEELVRGEVTARQEGKLFHFKIIVLAVCFDILVKYQA